MCPGIICVLLSFIAAPGSGPTTAPSTAPSTPLLRFREIETSSQQKATLNRKEVSELIGIVVNDKAEFSVRLMGAELLVQKAEPEQAQSVLDAMRSIADRTREKEIGKRSRVDIETEAVLESFLDRGTMALGKRMADPTPVFDFAMEVLGHSRFSHAWPKVYELIANGPAPLSARRQYVLKAIKTLPSAFRGPHEFYPLITGEMMDPLREIAFQTTPKDKPPHMPAVDFLVEFGDLASVPLLKERAAALGKMEQYMQPGAGMIWRIEAHQKPQMLLDFIQSDLWVDFGVSRRWALDKAVEIGVSKEQIRSALIAHAAHKDKNRWFKSELVGLKRQAIRQGVFRGDELPDIAVPTSEPAAVGSPDRF